MRPRILLVDDNRDNLMAMELLLSSYPEELEVERVDNGHTALDLIQSDTFSAALVDIRMPRMDGYELCRSIRALHHLAYVPIILMTSKALATEDRIAGYDAGCDDYIMKPIDRDSLFARLRSVLRIKEMQDQLRYERDHLDHKVTVQAKELAASEMKFKTLTTIAPAGIYLTDAQGKYLYTNNYWGQMAGQSREESLGDGWIKGIHPDDREMISKNWLKMIDAKGEWGCEYRFLNKEGKVTWVYGTATAIYDKDTITGYVGINADITERKKAEERLKNIENKIQQLEKMQAIGTLASGIAHDFNNILSAIIGYTDITLEKLPKDSPHVTNLKNVLKAGNRARHLVNQILMFGRQSTNRKKALFLQPIINEVVMLISASLPSSIQIHCDLQPDTRPVMADPTQIHEVIMNLCTNAAHAVNEMGEIKIKLREICARKPIHGITGTSNPGDYSLICFSDNGCGIDEFVLPRIFEPFFTTKKQGEGTGMGLAVIFGIVQNHHGNIVVCSKTDKGTSFRIYLPKTRVPIASPKVNTLAPVQGHERILFVDDEEMLANMAHDTLMSLGYAVESTTNSLQALALFKEKSQDFDLVITDQTMPAMSGLELIGKILAIRKDIPIIMCTGYSKYVNAETAQDYGINAFCMKPILKEDIARVIRSVLDKKRNKKTIGRS